MILGHDPDFVEVIDMERVMPDMEDQLTGRSSDAFDDNQHDDFDEEIVDNHHGDDDDDDFNSSHFDIEDNCSIAESAINPDCQPGLISSINTSLSESDIVPSRTRELLLDQNIDRWSMSYLLLAQTPLTPTGRFP